jgi:hypothetical protein
MPSACSDAAKGPPSPVAKQMLTHEPNKILYKLLSLRYLVTATENGLRYLLTQKEEQRLKKGVRGPSNSPLVLQNTVHTFHHGIALPASLSLVFLTASILDNVPSHLMFCTWWFLCF